MIFGFAFVTGFRVIVLFPVVVFLIILSGVFAILLVVIGVVIFLILCLEIVLAVILSLLRRIITLGRVVVLVVVGIAIFVLFIFLFILLAGFFALRFCLMYDLARGAVVSGFFLGSAPFAYFQHVASLACCLLASSDQFSPSPLLTSSPRPSLAGIAFLYHLPF